MFTSYLQHGIFIFNIIVLIAWIFGFFPLRNMTQMRVFIFVSILTVFDMLVIMLNPRLTSRHQMEIVIIYALAIAKMVIYGLRIHRDVRMDIAQTSLPIHEQPTRYMHQDDQTYQDAIDEADIADGNGVFDPEEEEQE
jgi:hypothetical protein